jgi:formamidopyrimidine-DNA glycosylase
MPELPDLTVFAESLNQAVTGRSIRAADYHRPKRLNVPPELFCTTVKDQTIDAVSRDGKGLLFQLHQGERFFVHLMLSGGFRLTKGPDHGSAAIFTLTFADCGCLVLFDPRGLASVTLNPQHHGPAVPDALQVDPDYLKKVFQKKPQLTVKECLIDQSLIAGIGNAYSDEILWHTRVAPRSLAGKVPNQAVLELAKAIPRVLLEATDYIRSHNPGIMAGEVREHLAVHNSKARQSPTGAPIHTEMVATKKTYCTDEQVLYR